MRVISGVIKRSQHNSLGMAGRARQNGRTRCLDGEGGKDKEDQGI